MYQVVSNDMTNGLYVAMTTYLLLNNCSIGCKSLHSYPRGKVFVVQTIKGCGHNLTLNIVNSDLTSFTVILDIQNHCVQKLGCCVNFNSK